MTALPGVPAAAPRELSANFYGKAALREAVTAKSVSHTC